MTNTFDANTVIDLTKTIQITVQTPLREEPFKIAIPVDPNDPELPFTQRELLLYGLEEAHAIAVAYHDHAT